MIEGKYNLKMETPMGEIKGDLELKIVNSKLNGIIEIMGNKNTFSGGSIEDNKFAFSGEFKTMLGNITYEILGIVQGDIINIYADTNKGKFRIDGERIKR